MSDHARRLRRLELVTTPPCCRDCGTQLTCRECGDAESRAHAARLHANLQRFLCERHTPSWLREEAARLIARADALEQEQLDDELLKITDEDG